MPTSLARILEQRGCRIAGTVPWGTSPPSNESGVYVVSLHGDPNDTAGLAEAPIDEAVVAAWIERVRSLTLDDARPEPDALAKRLARYWLPDEPIVYVGKATSLRQRLRQYYSTPLGDRRPHAGGHWIKTLANLGSLSIHYAEVDDGVDPEVVEMRMLTTLMQNVTQATRSAHPQSDLATPFANLEIKGLGRRNHGIRNAVLRD